MTSAVTVYVAGRGAAVDVLYDKGLTQMLFNGDWKSQALSESAYQATVTD